MKKRTKKFAVDCLRLCATLPKDPEFRAVRNQLVRSATSTGANYRAACRAKSTADFINKLKIVEEETDESQFWLEIIVELNPDFRDKVKGLWREANEIVAMTVAAIKRNREKLKAEQNKNKKKE